MENISGDFRDLDMKQAMRLAKSDAARQLFALVQSSNGPQLQTAMQQAAAGNMEEARALLQQLMQDEQTRTLLQQIQGDANG